MAGAQSRAACCSARTGFAANHLARNGGSEGHDEAPSYQAGLYVL